MISFEHPYVIYVGVPLVVLAFLIALRRGWGRWMVLSRFVLIVLLVLAIASPFERVSVSSAEESPGVVLVHDQTPSMMLFDDARFESVRSIISSITPPKIVSLTGTTTALGDTIIQNAHENSNIVLVSDGNSNSGADFADAVRLASYLNSRVFMVRDAPIRNDMSVEVLGAKNVVVGSESTFTIVVRAAHLPAACTLVASIDGKEVMKRHLQLSNRTSSIEFTHRMDTKGAHLLTVRMQPDGEDMREENNVFTKGIYVVDKPKVLLISGESSPLSAALDELYATTMREELPDNLTGYSAIVLDNQYISALNDSKLTELRTFVADGGGLVVVGGDRAYNLGDYSGSAFESMLPVESKPSTYGGGRSGVILIDISESTRIYEITDIEKAIVVSMLLQMGIYDRIGVVAFGTDAHEITDGLKSLSGGLDLQALIDKIARLQAGAEGSSATSLNKGLDLAGKLLENAPGSKHIIIVSDGAIQNVYTPTLQQAKKLAAQGVKMHFVVVETRQPIGTYAEDLMKEVGGEYYYVTSGFGINLRFGDEEAEEPPPEEPPERFTSYGLTKVNSEHFITRYVNVSGNITGYNEVTPKIGSERLIALSNGKPVLTVGRYGLGRVVALSTDNGNGWASVLYSEQNAKLISAMMNWAIGDPQRNAPLAVRVDDVFLGQSATLWVRSESPPTLSVGGGALQFERTGDNEYMSTITPEHSGILYISDYPLCVNYPIEYRDVGFSEQAAKIVRDYGGKVLTPEELSLYLRERMKEKTASTKLVKVDRRPYLLYAALLLFIAEVCVRRIREIRRLLSERRGM